MSADRRPEEPRLGAPGGRASGGIAVDATRLAQAATAIGEPAWASAAARLAGSRAAAAPAALPTYREVALAGVAVVLALARDARWAESSEQAGFLARYFQSADAPIGTVVGEAFGGLAGAAATTDVEGVRDFAELVLEVFE